MKTFMMAALGPGADEEKITDYCEGSVEHYNWLVDCGVPFKESFWGEPGWETAVRRRTHVLRRRERGAVQRRSRLPHRAATSRRWRTSGPARRAAATC